MLRIHAMLVALLIAAASPDRAMAQSPVSADAMKAAQAAVGTANLLSARVVAGDSLIISLTDAPLTMELFEAGEWLFGGLDQLPKSVGRAAAKAIRAGLPPETPVKYIVLEIIGAPPAGGRVTLLYYTADFPQR